MLFLLLWNIIVLEFIHCMIWIQIILLMYDIEFIASTENALPTN